MSKARIGINWYMRLQERISQLVQENALLAQQKERAMALLKKPTNE